MPLVSIDVLEGRPRDQLDQICDSVAQAMVELLDVPEHDRFHVVTEHQPGGLRFDRGYLDIERTDSFVLVRITLSAGRCTEAKRAFYARLAELLSERIELRPEDLTVVLVENEREDWSFGRGRASYLELPREAWR